MTLCRRNTSVPSLRSQQCLAFFSVMQAIQQFLLTFDPSP
uniref:Uncharacterized protein n=1 Tax=Anguilla anguilla TaxID=7936 RepID=A0A0E9VJJ9_ANGAN